MWLSGQHKGPIDTGEGQVGRVTIGGRRPAVQLDSERRQLEVFAPGGYRWTPHVGQRVLVMKNQGEDPAVVGAELDEAGTARVDITAADLHLHGQVYVNNIRLEQYILMVIAGAIV